jgi:hypothetical protein
MTNSRLLHNAIITIVSHIDMKEALAGSSYVLISAIFYTSISSIVVMVQLMLAFLVFICCPQ